MSVIIKDMKMPDSCASCQFCLYGILDDHGEPCTVCELIADNTPWGCGYKIIDGIDYDKERMYFCPLTPLPEHHGDLVEFLIKFAYWVDPGGYIDNEMIIGYLQDNYEISI